MLFHKFCPHYFQKCSISLDMAIMPPTIPAIFTWRELRPLDSSLISAHSARLEVFMCSRSVFTAPLNSASVIARSLQSSIIEHSSFPLGDIAYPLIFSPVLASAIQPPLFQYLPFHP